MVINQIKLGAIISYLGLFINILIGLIYTPWLINSIGKEDYGLYTLAMSIIGLLAFDFGLGNATTKYVSQYLAEGRQDKVDNLLGIIYKLYLFIDVLIFFILVATYFLLPRIYTGLTPDELSRFGNIFLIAALYCVISFPFISQNGILKSYEKFVQLKLCDLFHKLFIVITMSICLLCGYGLFALVFVNSLSGVLTILLKQYVIKKKTPSKVNLRFWNKEEIKNIFSFTLWVTISALAQRLIFNLAPSLLGMFADSKAIAVLGIAITLESYVYMFANAINGMFLPKVSRLLNNNDTTAISNLMIRVGRIQIFIVGFIIIWLIAFGNSFINVWLGSGYSIVYPCMLLIILPSFLQLPQEIGLTYIIAANKVKQQSYIFIIMGILNILLGIPLARFWGAIGMCLAIFLSYMVRTFGIDILLKKELHLSIGRFFKESFFKLSFPLFIICLLAYLLNSLFDHSGWFSLLFKSSLYLALYSIIVVLWGANNYEKKLIFGPIYFLFQKK